MKTLSYLLSRMVRWDAWRRLPFKLKVKYLPERPRRFPNRIQIEATSKCNFRCASCSHAREKGTGQHLGVEDFQSILDRLPWRPEQVILSGIGEPLMNPQFFPMVDILAHRGIRCEFYTNGSLLTPAVWPEILSRTNITVISISCDGATAKTFESLRVGGDFERWRRSVGGFLAEAKAKRPHTLSVGANVVVSRPNLAEIGDILRLAAELGFDNVSMLDPIPVDDVVAALCPSAEEVDIARDEASELAKSLGLGISSYFRRIGLVARVVPGCTQPWEYVFIRANGNVAPCCAVFGSDKAAVMGNIFRQEFLDIWHGDRYRQYRRACVSGKGELCRVCPYH